MKRVQKDKNDCSVKMYAGNIIVLILIILLGLPLSSCEPNHPTEPPVPKTISVMQ